MGPHAFPTWLDGGHGCIHRYLNEGATEIDAAEGCVQRFTDARVGVDVGWLAPRGVPKIIEGQCTVPLKMAAQQGDLFQYLRVGDAFPCAGAATHSQGKCLVTMPRHQRAVAKNALHNAEDTGS